MKDGIRLCAFLTGSSALHAHVPAVYCVLSGDTPGDPLSPAPAVAEIPVY